MTKKKDKKEPKKVQNTYTVYTKTGKIVVKATDQEEANNKIKRLLKK
jgi:hypothetical protein